jgi:glycosyl transferase family 25
MVQKIYIINLKDDTDRRKSITKELESVGWDNFEFIDAIKGSDLPPVQEMIDNKLLDQTFIDPNGTLTKNIIACSLSHKKAYQKMIADGHYKALILEDDIRFTDTGLKYLYADKLAKVREELTRVDWDIFMWGLVGENIPHYINTPAGFKEIREYKKYSPDWAAHAYQITRKAAMYLLKNNTPVRFAADVNLETAGLNMYCTPWTIIEQSAGLLSRFQADQLEQSFKGMLYYNSPGSHTTNGLSDKASLDGSDMYDVYFSNDRNIKYESKSYNCKISKDIEFDNITFKQFTDINGTTNNNWCHINF